MNYELGMLKCEVEAVGYEVGTVKKQLQTVLTLNCEH